MSSRNIAEEKFLGKQSNVPTYESICHLFYCIIHAIPWNKETVA